MDLSPALHLLIIGAGCAAAGYIVGRRIASKASAPPTKQLYSYEGKKDRHEVDRMAETMDEFKMVLVVRNDLKMGKGKIAAQCSHATLGLYKKVFFRAPIALERWEECGQVKVVTKVESEEELLLLQAKANSLKIASHITVDAGRTQIAPNSRTVMSLLGPSDLVDEVTGELKLL
ncbi:hypothetical protein KP509_35G055000 [Ceratopteris richardii]|uniref:peptidyl-tRNA hydrolase n=2 Tax=Ceratopteris richardii TaxID=49495 RepID=A0A8T2QHF0_CERRI|nr:hypothetical protein KP509_35G055000 [Ceratopteris richardii]